MERKKIKIDMTLNKFEAIILLLMPILGILVLIFIFFNNPLHKRIFPKCIFYQCTGLYCPGCGITRATFYLIHGNIIKAFDYNPLFILMLPLIIYLYILNFGIKINGRSLIPSQRITLRFCMVIILVIISFTILRNIPIFPFTFLAP